MTHQNQSARIPAQSLVDADTLAQLRKRSDIIGIALVAHAWGIIFASMALFYFLPNPITFILSVMLIGTRQLGLSILLHDAAHNALTKTTWLNDSLSDIFCGHPLFANTAAYRHYHLKHHARTQQDDDPDLVLSKPFPITRDSFRRKMIRDLTGQTAYQQRKAQFLSAFGPSDWPLHKRIAHFRDRLGGAVIAQVVIFILCATMFHWSFYFTMWLLPFFTYHMAITRIRNIAEHAIVPDNNDPFRNARTTKAGWLARAFIAPYWVNYHVAHHLIMHIPCFQLPKLHKKLIEAGYGPRMEIAESYFDIIKRATSRRDDPATPTPTKKPRLKGTMTDGFSTQ